ncbi:MAG TPA: hypothetical protein PLQ56_05235 [Aggregatilineales bacterium]|nr:hypothetical protein [Aggregatilineales bacterium]
MQPGLSRAIPMGMVGFAVGAGIAILIRLLQGLDPNPDAPYAYVGPAMTLAAFFSAGFFIWGMGGFDPRMNTHGEGHDEHHDDHAEAKIEGNFLGSYGWRVLTYVMIVVLAIAAVAFLPDGPQLKSVAGDGNPSEINYSRFGDIYQAVREFAAKAAGVQIPALTDNLANIQISYLVMFIAFTLFTIFSLVVVAGLIAGTVMTLGAAAKNPQRFSIPWRTLALIGLFAGFLLQLPVIAASLNVPTALLVPFFLIPPVAMLIAYRKTSWFWVFLAWTLFTLAMPVLVPLIPMQQAAWVWNLLIFFIIERVALGALKAFLPENIWKSISAAVYGITFLLVVVSMIAAVTGVAAPSVWDHFWQIVLLFFLMLYVTLLVLPVAALKMLIPPGVWQQFAAIKWDAVLPQFSRWLGGALRNDLPRVLGQ